MSFFKHSFAERTQGVNPSVIRELLKLVAQPDIISFAGGMPAPELFPAEGLAAAGRAAFSTPDKMLAALQYGPSEGYDPLRERIVRDLAAEGIAARLSQILITTGSQQGLDLIARVFLNPGDEVVVSNPTFLGALQTFGAYQARCHAIPQDDEGMLVEPLAEYLKTHSPKLIYAIPSFQNPTGVTMSAARKAELYAVARQYGVPIIEDDPYGELYFGAERPTSLKALDTDDGVMLLRTFSKTLAPGLRIGYAVLPEDVVKRVMPAKQVADLHSSALNQVMIHEYLETGHLAEHLSVLREVYGRRRDLMLAAMKEHFPAGCSWTHPEGGLFIWVTLPEGLDSTELLKEAITRKVAFIPGKAFFADGSGAGTCRLNFSNASEANILEGVRRLGEVLRQALPQQPTLA